MHVHSHAHAGNHASPSICPSCFFNVCALIFFLKCYMWNIKFINETFQKTIVSIFFTMKATILDTHCRLFGNQDQRWFLSFTVDKIFLAWWSVTNYFFSIYSSNIGISLPPRTVGEIFFRHAESQNSFQQLDGSVKIRNP